MSNWPLVRFGELYEIPSRNGVSVPKGDRSSGIKMVNMGELFRYDRIGAVDMARVPLDAVSMERSLLLANDLLFARRSLTLEGAGRCSIVGEDDEPRTFESSLIRVRLRKDVCDPLFFFFFFRSPQGRALIETIVEQVAVAGIRSSDLATLRVPVPSLDEQRAIVGVLGSLDDKVHANQRRARTCQDLLRAHVASAIAEAREMELVSSVVKPVQRRVVELLPTTPYIGLEHMPEFDVVLWDAGTSSQSSSARRQASAGDILFGRIRPYFGKVGIAPVDCVVAQSVEVLQAVSPDLGAVALVCLSSPSFIEAVNQLCTGTTMPQVKWRAVETLSVAVPPPHARRSLQEQVEPLIGLLRTLPVENRSLKATRDALLPELLSGRLHVRDAEEVA